MGINEDIIDKFKTHLRVVNRSSNTSVGQYETHLKAFFKEVNKDYCYVEINDVEEYISNKTKNKQWLARSQNTFISILSSFYDYVEMLELKKKISKLRIRKIPKNIPVHIKPKKIKEMITHDLKKNDDLNKRDNLMVKILFSTGIRQAELIKLKKTDFTPENTKDQLIKITGKGNKTRRVAFPKWLVLDILNYIKNTHAFSNEQLLFLTKNGNPLNSSDVYRAVRYKADLSDITASPHKLRSSYAREYLENDGRIEVLQELLGHSSSTTTRIYTDIPEKDLKKNLPKKI